MNRYLRHYDEHRSAAHAAFVIFKEYCGGGTPPRVPGIDTVIRLASRIAAGRSIEEAAAREYVYRWHLAIKAPDQCLHNSTINPACSIFGTPHTIGM